MSDVYEEVEAAGDDLTAGDVIGVVDVVDRYKHLIGFSVRTFEHSINRAGPLRSRPSAWRTSLRRRGSPTPTSSPRRLSSCLTRSWRSPGPGWTLATRRSGRGSRTYRQGEFRIRRRTVSVLQIILYIAEKCGKKYHKFLCSFSGERKIVVSFLALPKRILFQLRASLSFA